MRMITTRATDARPGVWAMTGAAIAALLLLAGLGGCVDVDKLVKQVDGMQGGGLSQEKIIAGLKQALEIGSERAAGAVGRLNGYYKNPQIRIPLPEDLRRLEHTLRTVGYGSKVDAFELSMNRAAERAAPAAKRIFIGAVRDMSFADARKILDGGDDAATEYFRKKTYAQLERAFQPTVHSAMSHVGVTHQYQRLQTKLESIPFTAGLTTNIDTYVTDRALDGLFHTLAAEERRIRRDPVARTTELLKEVFGSRN